MHSARISQWAVRRGIEQITDGVYDDMSLLANALTGTAPERRSALSWFEEDEWNDSSKFKAQK